jgi:hypothetical protein
MDYPMDRCNQEDRRKFYFEKTFFFLGSIIMQLIVETAHAMFRQIIVTVSAFCAVLRL